MTLQIVSLLTLFLLNLLILKKLTSIQEDLLEVYKKVDSNEKREREDTASILENRLEEIQRMRFSPRSYPYKRITNEEK